ncbi:MAG: ribonuclease III domain-containing protein [Bacteriovoracaceae bacterium]|nr:ribonuclease III domain-containing protein [Bacteriovoracaceae bacterium]
MHCLTPAHYHWLNQWISNEGQDYLAKILDSHPEKMTDLLIAFTHPSFFGGDSVQGKHFERLEFFGDAAVNYFITEELYQRFALASEGDLARVKAALISSEQLGKIFQSLKMENLIYLGKGELGQKNFLALKQLGKFFEALIASIIHIFGLSEAKKFFLKFVDHYEKQTGNTFFSLDHLDTFDAKTKLQNLCLQKWKTLPHYHSTIERVGGQENFFIELMIDHKVMASSRSYSKKIAEKMAAEQALQSSLWNE